MSYHWSNCPEHTQRQVRGVIAEIKRFLVHDVVGIYLHGSLALGCFNPASSDLDLVVVTARPMALRERNWLIRSLLAHSRHADLPPSPFVENEHPIEISIMTTDDLLPWRYPPRYDLHYSESWRERYTRDIATGAWRDWRRPSEGDPDLAAHLMVIRERGICLSGAPIAEVIPMIPERDYRVAILSDVHDIKAQIVQNPVYWVLNACRVVAYLDDGAIRSKVEGGEWGLTHLPSDHHALIRQALATYDGVDDGPFDAVLLSAFADAMDERWRATE